MFIRNYCKQVVLGTILSVVLLCVFGNYSVSSGDARVNYNSRLEVTGKIEPIFIKNYIDVEFVGSGSAELPFDSIPKIIVWSWKGGGTIRKDQLESTILAVLLRLPMVTADQSMVKLLQETAAIESDRGVYVSQLGNGPARGIFQMEINTIKDTIAWLNSKHMYNQVRVFYNKNKSEEWNYQHNVPWQIAMAAAYYVRMAGNNIIKSTANRNDRERVYKKYWNTHKGKSTKEKYFAKAEAFA